MQLFTVGLYELNNDGTKKLGENGSPIPIYTQDDVSEMARVFTGFSLGGVVGFRATKYADSHHYAHNWLLPIRVRAEHAKYHDTGTKTVLGQTIAGGLSPEEGIDRAIDILMANNNMAPHVCRSLITRLVTSNPTPDYMTRVVDVFNDNGDGVKGDLKATIRAILTDPEARETSTSTSFGKVDEYNLVATHYMSVLKVKAPTIRKIAGIDFENAYWLTPNTQYYNQMAMNARSVFNFYSPEHVPSDPDFSSGNFVAPEFELRTNNELISFSNWIPFTLKRNSNDNWAKEGNFHGLVLDLTEIKEYFSMQVDGNTSREFYNLNERKNGFDQRRVGEHGKIAIDKLIDYLDNLLMGGIMPDYDKTQLKEHLLTANVQVKYGQADNIVSRAIQGIIMSPSYMVLK
jgi:hypothetical protein